MGHTEKDIRRAILKKIKPEIRKGTKHDHGFIRINGVVVARIKIPNEHSRNVGPKLWSLIAASLHLKPKDFDQLVQCPLTGDMYYDILAAQNSKRQA